MRRMTGALRLLAASGVLAVPLAAAAQSADQADKINKWFDQQQKKPGCAVSGYGAARPIAPNTPPDGGDDPAGRQKNRRVEVVIDTCS